MHKISSGRKVTLFGRIIVHIFPFGAKRGINFYEHR